MQNFGNYFSTNSAVSHLTICTSFQRHESISRPVAWLQKIELSLHHKRCLYPSASQRPPLCLKFAFVAQKGQHLQNFRLSIPRGRHASAAFLQNSPGHRCAASNHPVLRLPANARVPSLADPERPLRSSPGDLGALSGRGLRERGVCEHQDARARGRKRETRARK